jgi:hypothetical protein
VSEYEPLFQVVRGDATADEIAALLAVLVRTRAVDEPESTPGPTNGWPDRAALLRAPLRPGLNAWRASAGPR